MKTSPLTNLSSLPVAARWGQRGAAPLLLGALLGLLGAPAARAQDGGGPRQAGVYRTHDLSYRVWGCNPAGRPGRVRLVNEKGQVYCERLSSATSLGGVFNLSGLPDGRYAFTVEIGRDAHRFAVQLRTTAQRLAEVSDDQVPAAPRLLSAANPAR